MQITSHCTGNFEGCFGECENCPVADVHFAFPGSFCLPSKQRPHAPGGTVYFYRGARRVFHNNTPCTGKGTCLVPIIHNASPGQGKPALARLIILKKINNSYAVRPG